MNALFGNKKIGIKPNKPKIRLERMVEVPKPKPLPSKTNSSASGKSLASSSKNKAISKSLVRSATSSARSSPSTAAEEHGYKTRGGGLKPKKRKATRQISPVHQRLESDSEDDDEDGFSTSYEGTENKRLRNDREVDLKRQLRRKGEDGGGFEMTHQADIPVSEGRSRGVDGEVVELDFQYPSASQRERYKMMFGKEAIDPATEIMTVATQVVEIYLSGEQAKIFKEPNTGIIRQLTKARNYLVADETSKVNGELLKNFKDAVDIYNSMLLDLMKDGGLAKNLDKVHDLSLDMVECLLKQVYDRAVSPQVDILKKKRADAENEKDNTYGELETIFVSKALAKVGLKSDKVFVDLGSGVGNVVLQAALEFGCESFGCEMMENACMLAKAQEKEFAARCRLWGLQSGKVRLEQGDFFESRATHEAIKKADVILVNNEVFSSDTNGNLISLFLDCKDGCKIISLQPFVEPGHEITERNLHDPRNQLEVERHHYSNKWVSWKYDGGDYYISTKNSKRLKAFKKYS